MITQAAIKHPDGKIYKGRSHGEILKAIPHGKQDLRLVDDYSQGRCQRFITDDGQLLGRMAAYKHAVDCGQISDTRASGSLRSCMIEMEPTQ